jgi:thioredoxin 1
MTVWQQVLAQCPCSGGGRDGIHPLIPLTVLVGLWWLGSWLWPKLKERGISMKALIAKVAVVVVLVAAVGVVLISKMARSTAAQPTEGNTPAAAAATVAASGLPRVLDLGSKSCIPCKMMAPILEQLKQEQAGRVQVDFIDVWENRQAGQQYGINLIPTQIFFDGSGKEVFRHEGFMSKEDILAKCRELGFALANQTPALPVSTEATHNG